MSERIPQAIYRPRCTGQRIEVYEFRPMEGFELSFVVCENAAGTKYRLAHDCFAYGYLEPTEHFPFERWPWALKYLKQKNKGGANAD